MRFVPVATLEEVLAVALPRTAPRRAPIGPRRPNHASCDGRLLHLRPRLRPRVARSSRSSTPCSRVVRMLRVIAFARRRREWLFDRHGPPRQPGALASRSTGRDRHRHRPDRQPAPRRSTRRLRRARAFMDTFAARVERGSPVPSSSTRPASSSPTFRRSASPRRPSAQVPAVALGNFTWDWIYAALRPGRQDVVDQIGEIYADADGALRLPMHGGFATFAEIVDMPFVARRSTRDPDRHATRASAFRSTSASCWCRSAATALEHIRAGHVGFADARTGYCRRSAAGAGRCRSTKPRCTPRDFATKISFAPSMSSSPNLATASSRSASPTTPRSSTRRAATSSNTTCWCARCRGSCVRDSSIATTLFAGDWQRHLDAAARAARTHPSGRCQRRGDRS